MFCSVPQGGNQPVDGLVHLAADGQSGLARFEVRLRERGGRSSRSAGQGHEAVAGIGDGEYEIAGLVVRVDRVQVLQRDEDGTALVDGDIEIARDLGALHAEIAALRREVATAQSELGRLRAIDQATRNTERDFGQRLH